MPASNDHRTALETLPTAVLTIDLREPIPGYVLGERLGSGGFGEVWRASAPGGLAKAIKIVYGQRHSDRAARELKALQRIKQVRHPLLLSLERIESIADNLVIVMELADGNLRDRQVMHREGGLPGIPRGELIAYLRDVADALDYLVEEHNLLHLDVKPENLLLVADRVKVADFGLLRQVDDGDRSPPGGMTPLYAAPEVFDGRPHRHTDQYSLAIVFQELLTGRPPFSGRTSAQLIAQHLHSPPRLESLSTFDRPIIARALSKEPERRFPGCRALVDALAEAPRTVQRPATRRLQGDTVGPANGLAAGDHRLAVAEPPNGADHPQETLPRPVAQRNLPPIDSAPDWFAARPTLFVGVGGLGTRVLRRLKQRLVDEFGDLSDAPAWQFLALETDAQMLAEATSAGPPGTLRDFESLLLPLRDSQDYRGKATALLEWMSRRWLYNIPRSRKTEGIRALGRLAFVDHFGTIADTVQEKLATATAAASLQRTGQRTGLRFSASSPNVFVVGATGGGTAGGMLLDLGYALRTQLKAMGLTAEQLCGILACVTPARSKAKDLAIANTIALLGELKQFADHRYPGEPACRLPADDHHPPFTHTYVTHQDAARAEGALQRSVEEISDYLFVNTAPPAAGFFQSCREPLKDRGPSSAFTLRSLGSARLSCQTNQAMETAVGTLQDALVALWTGRTRGPASRQTGKDSDIQEQAQALATKFLEMFEVAEMADDRAADGLKSGRPAPDPLHDLHESVRATWLRSAHLSCDDRVLAMLRFVDLHVTTPTVAGSAEPLTAAFSCEWDARFRLVQTSLCDWLAKLIDTPQLRLVAARHACDWLVARLEQLECATEPQLQAAATAAASHRQACLALREEPAMATAPDAANGQCPATLQAVLDYSSLVRVAAMLRRKVSYWQSLRQTAADVRRRIEEAEQAIMMMVSGRTKLPSPARNGRSSLAGPDEALRNAVPRLLVSLDHQLTRTGLGHHVVADDPEPTPGWDFQSLAKTIEDQTRQVLQQHFRQDAAADAGSDESSAEGALAACVARARPALLAAGGAKRTLLLVPPNGEFGPQALKQERCLADESVSLLAQGDGEVRLCFEVERIPWENVIGLLAGNQSTYLELASRLHVRTDVEWRAFDG